MKNGKWIRLAMGLCLLGSILFLPGTGPGHLDPNQCALDCLEKESSGYLEIHNNTPFNILVAIHSYGKYAYQQKTYGPFKITGNPTFMRINLDGDMYIVTVNVCSPVDQEPVYYNNYIVFVPNDLSTETLTITTPTGYFPVPKKK